VVTDEFHINADQNFSIFLFLHWVGAVLSSIILYDPGVGWIGVIFKNREKHDRIPSSVFGRPIGGYAGDAFSLERRLAGNPADPLGIAFDSRPVHRSPYVPTSRKAVERMLDMANVRPGEIVIDLGCGDGRVLREASRRGAQTIGYEISIFMFLIARLLRGRGSLP
jgi:hypothetical protein